MCSGMVSLVCCRSGPWLTWTGIAGAYSRSPSSLSVLGLWEVDKACSLNVCGSLPIMASGDSVPLVPLGQRPVSNNWPSPLSELPCPGTLTRGGGVSEDLHLLDLWPEPDSFLKRLGGEPWGSRICRPFPFQESPAATIELPTFQKPIHSLYT